MNVRVVAEWEFRRLVKVKDLVTSAVVMAAMFGGGDLVGRWVSRSADEVRAVAVAEAEALGLGDTVERGRFRFEPDDRTVDELERALLEEEIDALLLPGDVGWVVRVRRERGWTAELGFHVGALAQQHRWANSDLDVARLGELLAPPEVRTEVVEARAGATKADTVSTLLLVGAMMLGLFVGMSYLFVAITGEKTQRTTELMLSAVTPQQWIDGKILGLTGVVVVNLLAYASGYVAWRLAAWTFFDQGLSLPIVASVDFLLTLLLAVLGFGFWFTLFALVAATIDDPNSSGRSALMFLPFLPMSAVFAGLDSPDSAWMRALSMLPGLSPAAMPARLLRGEPSGLELAVAFLGLAVCGLAFRRAAGRAFGTAMLLTGKEPGWREVWGWVRASSGRSGPPA